MWNPIKFVMSKPGASLVLGGSLLLVLIMLEAPVLDPALAVCESYVEIPAQMLQDWCQERCVKQFPHRLFFVLLGNLLPTCN